jgi:hypothetical protein
MEAECLLHGAKGKKKKTKSHRPKCMIFQSSEISNLWKSNLWRNQKLFLAL